MENFRHNIECFCTFLVQCTRVVVHHCMPLHRQWQASWLCNANSDSIPENTQKISSQPCALSESELGRRNCLGTLFSGRRHAMRAVPGPFCIFVSVLFFVSTRMSDASFALSYSLDEVDRDLS
eukprot:c13362_g2_i1 orf=95-463(+)